MIKNLLKKSINAFGLDVKKINQRPPFDLEENFIKLYLECRPFTLCSIERCYALYKAVEYIVTNKIPGDLVECGVWRGGSCMIIAETLASLGESSRKIYLYDTFEGMTEPGVLDVELTTQKNAKERMQREKRIENDPSNIWAYASLDEVKNNLKKTSYKFENFLFIKGKVEETIPQTLPSKICLLRLDTDWYNSTRHELIHLYPLLLEKGVLIIDDYGHFKGARKAVDEYIKAHSLPLLLNRIDNTGRLAIK